MSQVDSSVRIPSVVGLYAASLWWLPVLRGLISLGLGITLLAWPNITVWAIVVTIGFFTIVDGLFAAIGAVVDRAKAGWGWGLAYGILSIGVGVAIMAWPAATVMVIYYFIAAWALIIGIATIAGAILSTDVPGSGWDWVLTWGIVLVAFSIVLAAAPAAGLTFFKYLIAIFAIINGLAMVLAGFALRSYGKAIIAQSNSI